MNLREFQKATVPRFGGLYRRGKTGQVPIDHAIDLENLDFNKTGECFTRWGTNLSLNLSHPVKRMFLATTVPGNYYLLTYDGATSIWIYDMQSGIDSVLYTDPKLTEFYAVNEWGRTYILPSGNDFTHTMVMQVLYWNTTTSTITIRPALGHATNIVFSVNSVFLTGGNIDAGVHGFAVSFITDTGFTTRPGPQDSTGKFTPVNATFDGTHKAGITGIPIGPAGTVARQILVTKADETEYFYIADGYIPDNTTTSLNLDWFDTDLAVSADSLFDLEEEIAGAATTSSGIFKYRGRTLIWGNQGQGTLSYGNQSGGIDKVVVSEVAEPESFDHTVGFVQLPSESDGNYVAGIVNLRDVLYFTKTVGIFTTQDNFDNPNTWLVVPVDGGVGCTFYAMSTISMAQTALTINEFALFADTGGIYIFNGVIQQPPITWKIDDIWKRVNKAAMHNITLAVDPFKQVLYCLVPVDNNVVPSLLLVGTATDGIDFQSIKWSIYNFPKCARCIGMANFQDSKDFQYLLRIGNDDPGLIRLDPAATDDLGTSITSYWQTALLDYEKGSLNIFRALRFRGEGQLINVSIGSMDAQNVQPVNSFYMKIKPGQEYTRQINYTAEQISIKILSQSYINFSRIDCFGKMQFNSRPLTTSNY